MSKMLQAKEKNVCKVHYFLTGFVLYLLHTYYITKKYVDPHPPTRPKYMGFLQTTYTCYCCDCNLYSEFLFTTFYFEGYLFTCIEQQKRLMTFFFKR